MNRLSKVKGMGRLYRLYLRTRFRLLQSHRHNREVLEWVHGLPILVLPGVMNPNLFRTGEFLAEFLKSEVISPKSTILDMGTGSGVAAASVATRAAKVVAVDINPAAVRCARINALLNGFEHKIEVIKSDLFSVITPQKFDVIIFNPPYLAGTPRDDFERSLFGTEVIEAFVEQVDNYLSPDGQIILVVSTMADLPGICNLFEGRGFGFETCSKRIYFNETLYVYKLAKSETQKRVPEKKETITG